MTAVQNGGADVAARSAVGGPVGETMTAHDAALALGGSGAASLPLRLMAIHAHPDDESSKGAASLAKYAATGVGVVVVSCTGGERGDILNQSYVATDEPLTEVRRREMAAAADALGVEHAWLGFVDSGYHEGAPGEWDLPDGCFADVDLEVESAALVTLIRAFKPHVVVTYDEEGGYPHPDHIRTHEVSVAAFDAAGDPDRFPETGQPWQPLKLYYHGGFSQRRLVALNDAMTAYNGTAPFAEWIERMRKADRPDRGDRVTTRVPVSDYFEQRDAALRAHATQIDPASHWFSIPHHVEAGAWGTDDYELVRSLVDAQTPESDLFAGVRQQVNAP